MVLDCVPNINSAPHCTQLPGMVKSGQHIMVLSLLNTNDAVEQKQNFIPRLWPLPFLDPCMRTWPSLVALAVQLALLA